MPTGQRIAVVHEWISARAGSEQVFEAIAGIYPEADLFALSADPSVTLNLNGRRLRTTMLDHRPLRDRRPATLPIMPAAWRALGQGDYDVVITSHHAFAHSNRLARPGGRHLAYVHSPARYVWSPEIDQRGASRLLGPARRVLRAIDRKASDRVDDYAANSTAVAERIRRYWHRDARVIHPPVRVDFFADEASKPSGDEYVLGFGRWIPYKNLHLVIEAAEIARLPVKIAGRGPDASRIHAAAAKATIPVEIIDTPDDVQLRELYAAARCLVFPAIEDFGIVPVEAQAAGTPVVAPSAGGALDTIIDGLTGALTASSRPADLAQGIMRTSSLSGADCRANAQRFGLPRFQAEVAQWVTEQTDAR